MSDICSAACWSSPHTFVRFYRLDSTTPSVAQSVLSAGSTIQPHLFSPVNSRARYMQLFFTKLWLIFIFFQAGRTTICSSSTDNVDHHRGQINIHNHTKCTSPDNQSRISPDFKCVSFDCAYSVCSSAFDRVLELTSTKEKMAEYPGENPRGIK